MALIEYLPFATNGSPNVESQAAYAGSGHQTNGFTSGLAASAQLNKVWRQASVMTAAMANFLSQSLNGINILDDGNVAVLTTFIAGAIKQISGGHVDVPFSNTAIFDCNKGTTFICTLTGDMLLPTVINVLPGELYTFFFIQDATGTRTFHKPTSGTVLVGLDTAPTSATTATAGPGVKMIQTFVAQDVGTMYATAPMLRY